jgi:hypothetical protein
LANAHYELAFLVYRADIGDALSSTQHEAVQRLPIGPAFQRESVNTICDVAVDIHHALSLDIEGALLLERGETATRNGHRIRVASAASLAFHLIFKLYWEGVHTYGKGLYQFADLCRLLPRLSERDASELLELLQAKNLDAAGFYVLRRLPRSFGISLPKPLADWVASERSRICRGDSTIHNDLGDVWPKLWGRRGID